MHKQADTNETTELIAVIDIGSSAIRMVIAELHGHGDWRVIDSADRPVALGRDVFRTGSVKREAAMQTLQILRSFQEQMAGWQIADDHIKVIATSALREARNRETFVDKVALRTGFEIEIIEGIEANRLTYMAVRHALHKARPGFSRSNAVIMEVGGGSTEVMLMNAGRMVAAHTLNLGTVRLDKEIKTFTDSGYLERFLRGHVHPTLETLDSEFSLKKIKLFIAVGGDARLAAREVGKEMGQSYHLIQKEAFGRFLRRLQSMSIDECVQRMHMSYDDAETLLPGLLIYQTFMEQTRATEMVVPNVSIRDGVLLGLSEGNAAPLEQEFHEQITASALSLGRKYSFDEQHARHTANLALKLFDQLRDDHGLDDQCYLLLEVAALLHEVGNFISTGSHHKHGQYIIMNSEIFGLHRNEMRIVGNVVRYHRKSMPLSSHIQFVSLSQEDRIIVMKLAAMLRVADALDRGHRARVIDIEVEPTDEELVIKCQRRGDLTAERMALANKGKMFEEVFGMTVVLE
jgi:exopolyphosphatase/guanosine-5'-triphosphate,3'-diphosphate pyrophosphatase